ncbi:MAG TPA: chloride channel protein, partial [Nodosilinea sp.]|nr:chloride channel protein [Nodosilinea sp.]
MLHKRLEPLLSRKRIAILEACVIGLVSGLAAVLLKQGVESLALWRTSSTLPLWLALPTIGLVGGWLSGVLVERWAPEASGSGIPQVKAALGFAKIPLNLRVALVKLGTTLLALGSGL